MPYLTSWRRWQRRLNHVWLAGCMLVLGLLLFIVSFFNPQLPQQLQSLALNGAAPLLSVVAGPLHTTREWLLHVANLSNLSQENIQLKAENQRLKEWYNKAQQLEIENRALQKFLRLNELPRTWFVSARVIGEVSQPNSRYLIIDVGQQDGVMANDVVLTPDGVVGRVQHVAHNAAHVMLLTDAASRVPVVVEESRYRAVVAGNNTGRPDLRFLPDSANVVVGSRLVTSGFGGIFLPGMPVGLVAHIDTDHIEVKPYVDWQKLDYVQVMRFDTNNTPQLDKPE